MKEYKPFTQIQDKLIPLSEESYNELKKSFLDNGFLRRKGLIEVWKGHDIIVDGHHRYAICKELGIEPEIEEVPFDSADEAELYALKNQRNRRNLTESQLIMVDVAIHDTEERIAAGMRMRQGNNQYQKSPGPESGPSPQGRSAEIIAKKIGKNKHDVHAIRTIQKPEKAVPEVAKLVRDGKLNHRRAYDFVQGVPKDKQAEIVAAGPEAIVEKAREVERARRAKPKPEEPKPTTVAEDAKEYDRIHKPINDKIKKDQEVFEQIKAASGGGCLLPNIYGKWCDNCNWGFDVYTPLPKQEPLHCPYCQSEKVSKRNEDWNPRLEMYK